MTDELVLGWEVIDSKKLKRRGGNRKIASRKVPKALVSRTFSATHPHLVFLLGIFTHFEHQNNEKDLGKSMLG